MYHKNWEFVMKQDTFGGILHPLTVKQYIVCSFLWRDPYKLLSAAGIPPTAEVVKPWPKDVQLANASVVERPILIRGPNLRCFKVTSRRHSCWMLIDVRKKQLRMIYDYTVTEYFFWGFWLWKLGIIFLVRFLIRFNTHYLAYWVWLSLCLKDWPFLLGGYWCIDIPNEGGRNWFIVEILNDTIHL